MLRKITTHVQLQKSYMKILYLHPAYNDTFVFLGMFEHRRDCIVHVNKDGKILFQYIFPIPMDAFGMIDDKHCILIQTRTKWNLGRPGVEQHQTCITVFDLVTYQFQRTPFNFFNQESDQTTIRCFSDTQYVCIQQEGRYNDNRYKLSYFQYPLKQNDLPISVYSAKQQEWTYQYITKQVNNHSMMAWYKARHDQQWEFRTFDLRDNPKGKFNNYKFKQQIGIPYQMNLVQVAINTMWQTKKNCFMLVCITNKGDQQKNPQLRVIQNTFICDVQKHKIRQAKFSFRESHDFQIDQLNYGRWSMFRTFNFKDGKALITPVYYVDNYTEQIIAEQTWRCSYLYKEQPTGNKDIVAVHNQFENSNPKWFKCSKIIYEQPKSIVQRQPKCAILFLLQGIYDDFDDDLKHDVVQIVAPDVIIQQDDNPIKMHKLLGLDQKQQKIQENKII